MFAVASKTRYRRKVISMQKQFVVYVMTNEKRGTLYIGVMSDLARRVFEHKNGLLDGFCKKYNLHSLGSELN